MKRFLSSLALCAALLVGGSFVFMPSAGAQLLDRRRPPKPAPADDVKIILGGLLRLPAPPPPNPFFTPPTADRDESFYDKKTPPADDAAIEDLLEYWKRQNGFDPKYTYTAEPSGKTLARLMGEVEKNPALLAELVDVFPETREAAEFVKNLYDEELRKDALDSSWRAEVKKWLTYHTSYFSGELYEAAKQAGDANEYVTNQDEVLALARVDFEKARPLLERMVADARQPITQTLARWAFYKRAMLDGDSLTADKYRKELQETVENKSLQPGNRDLAMDAIVESGDFPGRDDWYFSLLEDETLHDLRVNGQTYTGLTTIINHSPNDKYMGKMIELAASGSLLVRSAAARNLVAMMDEGAKNPEIVKALLPWLEDPKWARETQGERRKIVVALRTLAIPESVPGLIALLGESESAPASSEANANTAAVVRRNANAAANAPLQQTRSFPYRSEAIAALVRQKSPLAAAPLRQILPTVEGWERQTLVQAILVSNGFTIREQIGALEEYAGKVEIREETVPDAGGGLSNTATVEAPSVAIRTAPTPGIPDAETLRARTADPNSLNMQLGGLLVSLEEPGEELVAAVLDRIDLHERNNPALAVSLRIVVQKWNGPAVNALLLRDLKAGRSNLPAVVRLLALRAELRERQPDDVADARAGSPAALGLGACLVEQTNEYDAILDGADPLAQTALLACARMIRAPLSVAKVAPLLGAPDKLLAAAAESYLESEDSPEARALVLARHPNEARVLGARTMFADDPSAMGGLMLPQMQALFASVNPIFAKFQAYYFVDFLSTADAEERLRKEIVGDARLLGVYAYDDNFVRIYQDRVVYSREDDPARYRERELSAEEFEALKNYLAAQRVDELPPFLAPCSGCQSKELLMLGRAGGRRVFRRVEQAPPFFAGLEAIFDEFRRPPARIRYHLEKSVPGLEVLFADDNFEARTVWKNGADFRLLVEDAAARRRAEREAERAAREEEGPDGEEEEESEERAPTPAEKAAAERRRLEELRLAREKEYAGFAWYLFDRTKPLEPAAQPPGVEFLPLIDAAAVAPTNEAWKARAAGFELRADEEGLYKVTRGQLAKIRAGGYNKPVATPNGRWAVAVKYGGEEEEYSLVRVNLATNREFKVKVETEYGSIEPVAFVPALGRVLLFSGYGDEDGGDPAARTGDYYLLDPETGLVTPAGAEARPLMQQTFRPLQPVGASAELFWAALPDGESEATAIGLYSARALAFKPLLKLPKIAFDSMAMWVDEAESRVYFVYRGQLLALPLPKTR